MHCRPIQSPSRPYILMKRIIEHLHNPRVLIHEFHKLRVVDFVSSLQLLHNGFDELLNVDRQSGLFAVYTGRSFHRFARTEEGLPGSSFLDFLWRLDVDLAVLAFVDSVLIGVVDHCQELVLIDQAVILEVIERKQQFQLVLAAAFGAETESRGEFLEVDAARSLAVKARKQPLSPKALGGEYWQREELQKGSFVDGWAA